MNAAQVREVVTALETLLNHAEQVRPLVCWLARGCVGEVPELARVLPEHSRLLELLRKQT